MNEKDNRTAFDKAPIGRYLRRLRERYRQSINRLWLGHGAATLAMLSFIGANWKAVSRVILIPFGSFTVGLIFLGLAEFSVILRLLKVVKRNEGAETIIDLQSRDIESPLEAIDIRSANLFLEMLSAAAFVVGMLSGLLFILCRLGQ